MGRESTPVLDLLALGGRAVRYGESRIVKLYSRSGKASGTTTAAVVEALTGKGQLVVTEAATPVGPIEYNLTIDKIEPCPFCGNAPLWLRPMVNKTCWEIRCRCGVSARFMAVVSRGAYINRQAAISAWNTRHRPRPGLQISTPFGFAEEQEQLSAALLREGKANET